MNFINENYELLINKNSITSRGILTNYQCLNVAYWKKIRYHWRKNRKIFNLIFNEAIVPLRILRILERKKKVDSNLIFAWKNLKYINLCSTIVLKNEIMVMNKNSFCQTSLFNRPSYKIFFIEELSGCVCCANGNSKHMPIWWDQWDIILEIFNIQSVKLLISSLYRTLISNYLNFSLKKNLTFLKKLPKIFNNFFVNFSIISFLKSLFIGFIKLNFIKPWTFLF